MTGFLSWLYSQLNKVYDWFGSGYYALRNAAANAWNWAVQQAGIAYNAALEYAYSIYRSVITTIQSYVDWLATLISNVRNGLIEDILAVYDWIQWKFNTLGDFVSSVVNDVVEGIYAFVITIRDGLQSIIEAGINWTLQQISNAYGWILYYRDRLMSLLALFTPEKLAALSQILGQWIGVIVLFFSNPLVFIFDLIREHFVSFVCYVIAWSLGTIKYELPKEPPWRK